MSRTLAIQPQHLVITQTILRQYLSSKTSVWAFGSRATGNPKKFSDLDLAIDAGEPLTLEILAALREAFEESGLPYKVDLVDWQVISDSFKANIIQDLVKIEI